MRVSIRSHCIQFKWITYKTINVSLSIGIDFHVIIVLFLSSSSYPRILLVVFLLIRGWCLPTIEIFRVLCSSSDCFACGDIIRYENIRDRNWKCQITAQMTKTRGDSANHHSISSLVNAYMFTAKPFKCDAINARLVNEYACALFLCRYISLFFVDYFRGSTIFVVFLFNVAFIFPILLVISQPLFALSPV